MKLKKRNRIVICILLLIAICIELITLQLTRAKKHEDIVFSIIDYDSKIENEECVLTAINSEESGYYIILPEKINDKVVSKYFVEINKAENISYIKKDVIIAKETKLYLSSTQENSINENTKDVLGEKVENITEQNSENKSQNEVKNSVLNTSENKAKNVTNIDKAENKTENITNIDKVENIIDADKIEQSPQDMLETENTVVLPNEDKIMGNTAKIVELKPGDTIFLTEEEINSKKMNLTVKYETKEVNEKILYHHKINRVLKETNIQIDGFFPNNSNVIIEQIEDTNLIGVVDSLLDEKSTLMAMFKVIVKEGDNPFDCTQYGEKIEIALDNNDSTKKYKVLEIDSEKLTNTINANTPQLAAINNKAYLSQLSDAYGVSELDNVEQENNEVAFKTDSLDTYAVVSMAAEDEIQTFAIEDVVTSGMKWDGIIGTSYSGGDGSKETPFLILEGRELAYLAQQVNNGVNYEGMHFQLVGDIDLNQKSWTPIGSYEKPFMGIFDGAGHSISNGIIETETSLTASSTYSYGIFGAVQGGTATAEIKNTEFNNIKININEVINNTGVNVGIVTGTMFKNSKISNVLVKSGNIKSSVSYTVSSNTLRLLIGGIAGEATNTSTSSENPGTGNTYKIENCYASTIIDTSSIEAQTSGYFSSYKDPNYVAQVSAGGIIGRIRSQNVWPENCLVETQINVDGFIGPIFGTVYNNTSYDNQNNFNTLWNGNDASNGNDLTMTSYYTNYSVNGTNFTSSYTKGTTPDSTTYRKNASLVTSRNVYEFCKYWIYSRYK